MYGGGGNDSLWGDTTNILDSHGSADDLFGGNGNDFMHGGEGFDWCHGGLGTDNMDSFCEGFSSVP